MDWADEKAMKWVEQFPISSAIAAEMRKDFADALREERARAMEVVHGMIRNGWGVSDYESARNQELREVAKRIKWNSE